MSESTGTHCKVVQHAGLIYQQLVNLRVVKNLYHHTLLFSVYSIHKFLTLAIHASVPRVKIQTGSMGRFHNF